MERSLFLKNGRHFKRKKYLSLFKTIFYFQNIKINFEFVNEYYYIFWTFDLKES